MFRTTLFLLAALALGGCKKTVKPVEPTAIELPGGLKLLEEVDGSGEAIAIPYKKFVMPNGLTVVLHQDTSDPIVHVDVTYHVGSAREEIGKSGFAHFFEHMMFQGSENVADEEHFKIITEAGGTLNGTTNTDRTNYFETVPSNQLEKMLWLEADRMGFLLNAVTQEKFEVQRETVKNERGQRVDNRPYGLVNERLGEALFPEGHPYSWTTIGYIDDLNRADVTDLKRFFQRWYGPNNAVLTVGGKFDEAETLAWIAKYFGTIPKGPDVENAEPVRVTLDADRYISFEDKVAMPLIYMEWPTVYARHPDEAPLDVLMSILGSGKTSLLYKNLVKEGIAVQANAGHGCRELSCEFSMLGLVNPGSGKTLADVEAIMRASLEEFETRGVKDDDLQRVKQGIVSGMVFGLESVSSKVSSLAAYQTFTGDPNYIGKDIARYENVTAEDVVRVYEKYIKGQNAVILSVVPKGQTDLIAHEDTWTFPGRTLPDAPEEEEAFTIRRGEDTFDRSVKPAASGNPVLTLPSTWRSVLENGIEVLGAVNDETPTTAIMVRLEVGQKLESPEKAGLASMTALMLNEATEKSTNEELSNRLDKLGSSVRVDSGNNSTTLVVRSLTENLDETLAIAAEKLLQPKFDQADFDRVKQQVLQGIAASKNDAGTTASEITSRLLYGEDNAFAYPDSGTAATVEGLTLDDVKAFYAANYKANEASIIAVSDVAQADLVTKLGVFGEWATGEVERPALKPFPELAGGTLYLVDKPGAAQSEIRIAKRARPWDATGPFYEATLMNYPLGGAFNSRINLNLREDKGYTYGARAGFSGDHELGRFQASAGVRTDATKESLVEFFKEIDGFRESGMTAEELAFTKSSIGQRDALKYETPLQKLGFLERILAYDLDVSYVDEQKTLLDGLTLEKTVEIAAEELNRDDMIVVVVGDASVIREGLDELGLPIVELEADGSKK